MAEEGIAGLVGSSVGEAAAFAAGLAIAPVLEPYLQELRNLTWSGTPTRPSDPATAAEAVAENAISFDTGKQEASLTGLAETPFSLLVETIRTAPDLGTAFNLWRRDYISDDDFGHALNKAKLEERWIGPLRLLKTEFLTPPQVALAIVRSLIDSHGLLTGENPTTGGVIESTPVSFIDPLTESAAGGIGEERLRVMVNSIGLPMALQAAANAVFRGIIQKPDFYLAVAQGDTRPAWADAIFEQARQILTAAQYVEGHLRGWISEPEMYAGTAKHGMSQADTDLLFKVSGRPITLHQITTGLARGGTYPSTYDDVPEPYRKSLEEGNIRPEWAALDYANRYSYNVPFWWRALTQASVFDAAQANEILLKLGNEPAFAEKVTAFYAQPTPAKVPTLSPAVKSAQTKFITAIHKAYVGGAITHDQMVLELQLSELSAADQAGVADFFGKERDLNQLPPPPPPAP